MVHARGAEAPSHHRTIALENLEAGAKPPSRYLHVACLPSIQAVCALSCGGLNVASAHSASIEYLPEPKRERVLLEGARGLGHRAPHGKELYSVHST
jgi:hypothetical protein